MIIIQIYDTQTLCCTATSDIDWYFGLRYTQIECDTSSQIECDTASDVSEVALGSRNLDDDEN